MALARAPDGVTEVVKVGHGVGADLRVVHEVENTGIIDRDKARHESVSQVQLLGLPGQLVQGVPAADSRAFPIGKQVLEQDATMRSDFAVRQFVRLQKAHQVRTRHVEKVSRLLRRQFSVDWNDRDGVALRHLRQDVDEHAQRRDRDLDLPVAVDEAQPGSLAAANVRRQESAALPGDLDHARWGALAEELEAERRNGSGTPTPAKAGLDRWRPVQSGRSRREAEEASR